MNEQQLTLDNVTKATQAFAKVQFAFVQIYMSPMRVL